MPGTTLTGRLRRHTLVDPGLASCTGLLAMLVLIGVTLTRAFGGPGSLYIATGAAASVLVGAGYRSINPGLRTSALTLLGAGALALPFATDRLAAIQRGVLIAGLLLSLIASVMLIARCAVRSDRIQLIGAALRERQGGQRYVAFTLASQLFSGLLGLAGANLLFIMAAPATEPQSPIRTDTVVAVARGFAGASCWSPVFGNMAILLVLYPSLHWIAVFPVGLAIGLLTAVVGAAMHQFGKKKAAGAEVASTSVVALLGIASPLLVLLVAFLGLVLAVSHALHIVIAATIVLLAPAVSLLFHAISGQSGQRLADGVRGLGQGILQFPALAGEALLFMSAGCAGSILAAAFPASWVLAIGATLGSHPVMGISFLLLSILVTAVAGIHPVLSAVFLASTMTPQVLDLPPIAHIAAILAGWGLSTSVTPFSILSLTASRYAGTDLVEISLGRNWAFALGNAMVVCALLTGYVFLVG